MLKKEAVQYPQVYHNLCNTAQNSDEIENVPRVSEVVL